MILIPLEESARDEAGDSEFRDFYENPEGADLGNEGVVQGCVAASEFVDKVIAQF